MKNRPIELLCIALAGLTLAGCSLAPVYQRPEAPLPAQWPRDAGNTGAPPAEDAMRFDWQEFVTDAHLRSMVAQALTNNHDLKQTLLNLELVRAQYQIQRADQWPGVELQAGGARQRIPGDLAGGGKSQVQASWQAGIGVTAFEADLFGRVRSLSESALQEYLATEKAVRSAKISLVAEVIQSYLVYEGARQRHQLAIKTLLARESSLVLTQRRVEAGAATALDAEEATGLAEQARAEVERIEREARQAGNALVLLTGSSDGQGVLPGVRNVRLAGTALVQEIGAGAPSRLLEQRPDIQAAEHRLQARNADIGAARAAFFPRISLTGFLGSSSAELSGLFDGGHRSWSFMPQLSLPILDGGRNRAGLELATVRRDMAVAAYEQTIQSAFREAADALAAVDTLRREEAARQAAARSAHKALALAEQRYRAGVDDHLRYLDAQRTAYVSEMAAIETGTQRQLALASLFKALGGGWTAVGARQ